MSSNRIKAEPTSPSLSIDQAVLMTGISAFTLRNWEKRYDFLRPERRANGFREYSEAQVELLKRIHGLILQGARIGELATVIRRGKALPSLDSGEFDPAVQAEALELYARLRDYDLTGAEAKVAALESVYIPEQMLDLIYQPLLSKIGREWAGGRANIAQEHFASAFIRVRLAHYMTLPVKDLGTDPSRRRLLLASVSGEHHEGGLMLLTAHLRLRGWLPYFLGAGVSVPELHSAAQTIQPALICLSFTDPHVLRESLSQLGQLAPTPVCVGGFAAALYDREERLPPHVRLLQSSGLSAARQLEEILERTVNIRSS